MREHIDPAPIIRRKSSVARGPGAILVLALLAGALAAAPAFLDDPADAARDVHRGPSLDEARTEIDEEIDKEIASLIRRRLEAGEDPTATIAAAVAVPKPRPAAVGPAHDAPSASSSSGRTRLRHAHGEAQVSISSRDAPPGLLAPVKRSPTISPEAFALAASPPRRPPVRQLKPMPRAEGAAAADHAAGGAPASRSEGWPDGWSDGWSGGRESRGDASRRMHPSRIDGLVEEAERLLLVPPRALDGASALACLAVTIYHEARDQPALGQRAVAAVVLRRVDISRRWGGTICEVVQPVQFSYLTPERGFGRIVEHVAWRKALSIAVQTMVSGPVPALAEADHYHTTEVSPAWLDEMVVVARIADHVFYRDPRSLR